jgi:hypothetical protein
VPISGLLRSTFHSSHNIVLPVVEHRSWRDPRSMRHRVAVTLSASVVAFVLCACQGHATDDLPKPANPTSSRVVIGEGPATVVTKVCRQPIVRLPRRVTPVVLNSHGSPLRLHGRAYGGHVFRVSGSCRDGNEAAIAPPRCAQVVERAVAKDQQPTAIQVKELCSYNVTVAGHIAAIVTVSRR